MHILHTALYTFPRMLTRRICLPIKSFFRLWSYPLFSWPYRVIQGWYWKEKFDTNHSKGLKGLHCKQIDSMLPRACSAIDHRWRPPLPFPSPLPKVKRKRGNVYENLASVSPLGGEDTATCRLPKPKVETDKPYRDLDYSGYHYKTESNHCLIIH